MIKGKLTIIDDGLLAWCPACDTYHLFDSRWTHNGDFDNPSFTPSMHINADQNDACHSFLTDGIWHYCSDSKHEYANKDLALPWEGETLHILPINDLREHDEKDDGSCWCIPSIAQKDRGRIITHNSADGREILEKLNIQFVEIPSHLSSVAEIWLFKIPHSDPNTAIANEWISKRYELLKRSLDFGDASKTALAGYFQSLLFKDFREGK